MKKNKYVAEIVGLSFGDGSLTFRKNGSLRYQLRGHVEEKVFYDKHIIPLFEKNIGKVNITHYTGKKPYYGICSENQYLCLGLKSLGIPVGPKKDLKIPAWIKSDESFLKMFLRGLFDTDGSLFCGKDYNYSEKKHIKLRMSLASTSYNLIKEVSLSLKRLGIHNLIIKPYKQKKKNWKDLNKIQIDGPNVQDFLNNISLKNFKHLSKYKIWKHFGFCPPHTSLKQRERILRSSKYSCSKFPFICFDTARVAEPGQKIRGENLLFLTKCASPMYLERKVEGLVP
ncbi:hypothetical protein CMO92_03605 [Candidatus Woesearchaeota archaeon]|nr:hypothetical protein [Candidatus Woesearchaeota archaeon]|tara:strand:- start:2255 stop:3106 length:852 start_codon:yes stop_codon:yes gene_type:complete